MTLFGPPAAAPGLLATPGARPANGNGWHDAPAFERRALLRGERHRLVAEVRRHDGSSHREINAWLNRRVGITRVEEATIEQLERSVELLVGKLTSRR
jgi:hypothetical protein